MEIEIVYEKGGVTKPRFNKNEIIVIPHVCNNGVNGDGVGVMGAGGCFCFEKKVE